ncbi:Type III restriction enzyme, res subunit [Alkalithermobacter thermoalcaliphilus JW-YL-7 = DSM 7308]|uniref:Type III restriction enzyme, res subunit n=1 Tax=Alkalithermobacter thermoalcaliphilus JW-YL-7 = DSM 7308 TaxID=1121328 RepID=A0A150FSY4_CLOPD|nr:type III restriction protein res subunit [[Clostridium] paradoxum JW-YL-7 = DSM 7308]SHL10192.1 Type III restriction enzyme, res subunit [[Clostridium] paradoxum JW-YL-7 = DSM 7308]
MATKKQTKKKQASSLEFYKKLVLNQYMLNLFGVNSFEELSSEIKKVENEGYDENNNTIYCKELIEQFASQCAIPQGKLIQYDENIVKHTFRISEKRGYIIKWKYFQYLSLLFSEIYLDKYFSEPNKFLEELNEYVRSFNSDKEKADRIDEYTLEDLNKLAFWNATGSGKTLIMHINILQYMYYLKLHGREREINRVILLTPSEGLSNQHLIELELSGFKAELFDKNAGGLLTNSEKKIEIIDIHKLKDEAKEKTVAVDFFEKNNLVLVDEGHRGSSGKDWKQKRDTLCEKGFSFEYSATFGQAVKNDSKLIQEYAKCIIFDYSYRYFHGDGYGKDYNILNLADDKDEDMRNLYLTACLMMFYQQLKIYEENREALNPFMIEKPLLVFVGSTVNAVRTENKKNVSDVIDILLFFDRFIKNERNKTVDNIQRLLSGNAGLLDSKNREIFRDSFFYLKGKGLSQDAIFMDMLKIIFADAIPGAQLHIDILNGTDGEIGLKVGDAENYFGCINVGDSSKLIKLCEDIGLNTEKRDFSSSLFRSINETNSTINVLIGSKKFSEGWNSWRVSTMGLMNMGKKEGSEVIQLFGRGVRLKGYEFCLKRSKKAENVPSTLLSKKFQSIISLVETLNVFGVRADYMQQFKEYLKEEGMPDEENKINYFVQTVINLDEEKLNRLKTLKLKEGLDFKRKGPRPVLNLPSSYPGMKKIVLDYYQRIQYISSDDKSGSPDNVNKHIDTLKPEHLAFVDFDKVYFELERFKNEKSWYNLNIPKGVLREIMQDDTWYILMIPEDDLKIKDFRSYMRFQEITTVLLKKYCEAFYNYMRQSYELPNLEYRGLEKDDRNFVREYSITVYDDGKKETIKARLDSLVDALRKASEGKSVEGLNMESFSHGTFDIIDFEKHLYSPLIHVDKNEDNISVSPVELNEGERQFVLDLRDYCTKNKDFFNDKELYLLRNKAKSGIVFFEAGNFYPDFIMWIIEGSKQYIAFIDPKGIRSISGGEENPKIQLYKKIKELQANLCKTNPNVILNSFIVTPTRLSEIKESWRGTITKEELEKCNVLLQKDDKKYIEKLINKALK